MLNTARAHFCTLQEEIIHINYQLLPTATVVILVIKVVINVCRCLCKMPVILTKPDFVMDFKSTPPPPQGKNFMKTDPLGSMWAEMDRLTATFATLQTCLKKTAEYNIKQ
jgi:hypothetical protein